MKINEIASVMAAAKKIHFLGVGGISMSSLALMTLKRGYYVSGSDWHRSAMTEKLENEGIEVFYGNREDNVRNSDVIVYTAAAQSDNPELAEGKRRAIPLITRGEYLGWLMSSYKYRIGVSGTHGKSSVTSMLAEIFIANNSDPTVVNGAELSSIGGAYRLGGEEHFIFEACEYCDSFLSFCPTTAVVTNLEYDHADYFKDMDQLRVSFRKYIDIGSTAVLNADDNEAFALAKTYSGKVVTFSCNGKGDYNAENIVYNLGCGEFDIVKDGEVLTSIKLSVPGVHNVYNAIAAAAAALENGAYAEAVRIGLEGFRGAKRRFEYKGKTQKGADVYIDYAHHPSEIKTTLSATKAMNKRVVCVFQPHTFSRTKSLFEDFTMAFADASLTLFADIYPARETDDLGVSSSLLAEHTENSRCLYTFENISKYLLENCSENDVIMILGAGDVIRIADMITEK